MLKLNVFFSFRLRLIGCHRQRFILDVSLGLSSFLFFFSCSKTRKKISLLDWIISTMAHDLNRSWSSIYSYCLSLDVDNDNILKSYFVLSKEKIKHSKSKSIELDFVCCLLLRFVLKKSSRFRCDLFQERY